MTAKYWQKGEVLDYKASAAVKNGEVASTGESSSKVNNIPAGYAAAPAASADETVLVKLLG